MKTLTDEMPSHNKSLEQCYALSKYADVMPDFEKFDVRFIRSQDEISIYTGKGNGRQLTVQEVWDNLPQRIFGEIIEHGSSILTVPGEPEKTFKAQRLKLGLDIKTVAQRANVSEDLVKDVESGKKAVDSHSLCNICQVLNIDDYTFSASHDSGRPELSIRLKTTKDGGKLTKHDLPVLTSCAWIAEREVRLQKWLNQHVPFTSDKNPDYGSSDRPAFRVGYDLAKKTRELLGIPPGAPIPSMRDLCKRLAIPYIQTELSESVAGLTLASGNVRSIVVNMCGRNKNPWLRRVTVAHELGHLLWDPDRELNHLNLDTYEEIEKSYSIESREKSRWVEQRANAFAVEFLLPSDYIDERKANESVGSYIRKIMNTYGVSFTSTKQHLYHNHMLSDSDLDELDAGEHVDPSAPDEWKGKEDFTADYFPIPDVMPMKRGMFSYWVCKALQQNIISDDSAASFLGCEKGDIKTKMNNIIDLFSES